MNEQARVTEVFRYPVKSCRGISVDAAYVTRRGIDDDRRWMVVDPNGRFLTQRTEPRLALVDVSLSGGRMTLSLGSELRCVLPSHLPSTALRTEVEVWQSRVEAALSLEGSEFFSEVLGRPARAVYMPDDTLRSVDPRYGKPGDIVSFADGYPLLLASASSLRDLLGRMDEEMGMERFRPNVVVDGLPAWAEDRAESWTIGDLPFRSPKGCDRCVVTLIDPRTGRAGKEPLRALSLFRKREGKVYFGINLIPDREGELRVGDAVSFS